MSKYITRIDTRNTHGFQVRLARYKDGKMLDGTKDLVSKFFSDSHYKSQLGCKQAAARWRNVYLREHNVLHYLKVHPSFDVPAINSGRNSSGAIGVVYTSHVKNSSVSHGYKAEWSATVKGKRVQLRREFACLRYGECEAFKMACQVRHEHCGTIIITDRLVVPCLPDVPYEIKEKS